MQIVINAGGLGTRLWPLSSNKLPKQFSTLIGDKSLLQTTYYRLLSHFGAENIWVNTNHQFTELVKTQLPEIPLKNILSEPERRDTFAAVAGHAAVVAGFTSEDENILFVHSDHNIEPLSSVENLVKAFKRIDSSLTANQFPLIIAGIKPTSPSSQFGYIEIGQENKQESLLNPVKVQSFKEKPDLATATEFLKSGNYLWNFGTFAFKYSSLVKILEQVSSQSCPILETFRMDKKILPEGFKSLVKNSFDYEVIEKIDNLGVVAVELETWEDIGNYEVLLKYLDKAADLGSDSKSHQVQISGTGNRIKIQDKTKKIAFVGVSDLLVVETENGLLIINPQKSGEIKKVSEYFESK
ncbi:MAG: sugar phosphate nucleotidyltransferase [bacterium]